MKSWNLSITNHVSWVSIRKMWFYVFPMKSFPRNSSQYALYTQGLLMQEIMKFHIKFRKLNTMVKIMHIKENVNLHVFSTIKFWSGAWNKWPLYTWGEEVCGGFNHHLFFNCKKQKCRKTNWRQRQYIMLKQVEIEKQAMNTCIKIANCTAHRYNNLICRLNLKGVTRNYKFLKHRREQLYLTNKIISTFNVEILVMNKSCSNEYKK